MLPSPIHAPYCFGCRNNVIVRETGQAPWEDRMDLGLQGKTALVCASSHGLGFATASRLGREGASVAICGRDAEAVATARRRIEAEGSKAYAMTVDLSDADDRIRLVCGVEAALGPIDIAVLNTGGPPTGPFESLSLDQWQGAFKSLIEPAVHLSQLVLPGMAARKWGRVLAVTSFVARQPAELMVLSNSLRASVIGLMRTLANEYGPHGVTVNSILPGYILTDRMRNVARSQAAAKGSPADQAFSRIEADIPLGRLGRPQEFGDLAAFLVSEAASYVTGAAITIDGGLSKGVY
jgi:3-oxoacyl-[acyl-carrier protein] reductase